MSLSLSETPSVKITYDTPREISDEVLGGVIRLCRETGYKMSTKMLAFLWSSFLYLSKEILEKNGILNDTLNCFIRSLGKAFPKVSDGEIKEKINSLLMKYWDKLCVDFDSLSTNDQIPFIIKIADELNKTEDDFSDVQSKKNPLETYSQYASSISSNIYCILHDIDNRFCVQYKYVLDEFSHFKTESQSSINMEKSQKKVYENTHANKTNEKEQALGMAWYKFLIYFSLIAGAIINFIYSFGYISGSIYLVQTNGEFYAEQIYAYYGKNLQVVDVFYGFFLIAFAILSLVVRHKLANYKPDSLKFVKIFYSISVAVPFLYDFSVAKIIGQSLSVQTVIYAIFGLIFLLLNIKYFNKRSHLFVDKTVWTQTNFQSPTQAEQEDGESSIVSKPAVLDNQADMFCRKCGTKLHEDSAFCHYCGTPIGKSANTSFTNTAPPISHSNVSKQRSKKRTVIIAIIIVLALVFTAGIVALFMNNNESDGNNSDRPATVYNVAVRTISLSDKYTAENILTTWRNGKATEQSLIEIMDEYGAWQGGGKLYVIERGEFVEEIDEWCFSTKRKVGDCAIIENEYGYSICYISGFNEKDNDDWNDNTPSYEDIGVTFEQNILARMITDDPVAYCEYIVELDKTLSKGSYGIDLQKEKATEYVNNLPLDYGQRIILFKIQFPADTTYCNDIVEYLNEMEALSYDDRVFILEELGFAVFEDGTVKW